MKISAVVLYHPAPWGWLYSYRVILVTLRMIELWFIAVRYLFFRAPILLIWTRLPGLRDIRPPYKALGEVLAPTKELPLLTISEAQMGAALSLLESIPDAEELIRDLQAEIKPPSWVWSVLGSVIRGYFTDLGPTFLKFGQILSMREEVPAPLKRELQALQDKLPAMSYQEVRRILEKELARPLEEVFEYVEEKPIAAASLAQVQRAKLRREQEEVALKIQRPYLQGTAMLDTTIICDILFGLINIFLPLLKKSSDTTVFTSSFRDSLIREIDFVLEERTQAKFRKLIMKNPLHRQACKVARTYPEYTTTKLLTMELVKNYYRLDRIMDELTTQQLMEFATTKIEGYPPEFPLQPVFHIINIFIQGILDWGITHGDLHLGNMYALAPEKEGENWKIFLCDFGMMIEEIEPERMFACHACSSLGYYFEGKMIADTFGWTGRVKPTDKQLDRSHISMDRTWSKYFSELEEGAEKVWRLGIRRGTSTNAVSDILYGMATVGIRMDPFGWLFLKNASYLAVTGQMFATNFNGATVVAPYASKYIKDCVMERLNTKNITNLRDSVPETLRWLRPYDRKQALRALATGEEVKPMKRFWVIPKWADLQYKE